MADRERVDKYIFFLFILKIDEEQKFLQNNCGQRSNHYGFGGN